jgi:hypothetical protein
LTILCIIEVRFFVSSVVLKSPPERKAENRYPPPPQINKYTPPYPRQKSVLLML